MHESRWACTSTGPVTLAIDLFAACALLDTNTEASLLPAWKFVRSATCTARALVKQDEQSSLASRKCGQTSSNRNCKAPDHTHTDNSPEAWHRSAAGCCSGAVAATNHSTRARSSCAQRCILRSRARSYVLLQHSSSSCKRLCIARRSHRATLEVRADRRGGKRVGLRRGNCRALGVQLEVLVAHRAARRAALAAAACALAAHVCRFQAQEARPDAGSFVLAFIGMDEADVVVHVRPQPACSVCFRGCALPNIGGCVRGVDSSLRSQCCLSRSESRRSSSPVSAQASRCAAATRFSGAFARSRVAVESVTNSRGFDATFAHRLTASPMSSSDDSLPNPAACSLVVSNWCVRESARVTRPPSGLEARGCRRLSFARARCSYLAFVRKLAHFVGTTALIATMVRV